MFQFDIQKWIPKFIWNDRNGHALAMAINAGLQMLNDSAAEGLKLINDYDDMPEWRLDELAWETNCLYDYNAPIETKRQWIKNALPFTNCMELQWPSISILEAILIKWIYKRTGSTMENRTISA